MDYDYLERLRKIHPAWRFLTADSAPLIISFFERVFLRDGIRSVSEPALEEKLENYLKDIHHREQGQRLTFPMIDNSIIIFGLGYGISILEEIPWLKTREIFYWGDIDTHGFSILSKVRKIFPGCVSFLMDEAVLKAHIESCVEEPESRRFTGTLARLTPEEAQLFEDLKNGRFGTRLRLEQEMVQFDYVVKWIEGVV